MVKFRCKRSGNTVSFTLPHDIESMRKHEGYEEVKEEIKDEVVEPMIVVAKTKRPYNKKSK